MRSRRQAREAALQALYQCDTTEEWSVELVRRFFSAFKPEDRIDSEESPLVPEEKVCSDKNLSDNNLSEKKLSDEKLRRTPLKAVDSSPKLKRICDQSKELQAFAEELIFGTFEYLDFIDQQLTSASLHWSVARMSRVDRNVLRLAVFEMGFMPEIPKNVSINEAIELAKTFGTEESPMFINGVLDNIAKAFAANPHICQNAQKSKLKKIALAG